VTPDENEPYTVEGLDRFAPVHTFKSDQPYRITISVEAPDDQNNGTVALFSVGGNMIAALKTNGDLILTGRIITSDGLVYQRGPAP
jgi:hypothetical protein